MDDAKIKLLSPDLSQAKRALLFQTVSTAGWKVVLEIINDACVHFQQDTFRVNVESEDGERIIVERQRRARNVTEFSKMLTDSIRIHSDAIRKSSVKEEEKAVDAVGAMFGIHDVRKDKPADAIKNVFGIHPARPVKKKEAK